MKQLIAIFITILFCQMALAQTEKQIPDTMTIKRFSQLDSGKYFFIYSESPTDSLHLGLDSRLKCAVCPTCPTCPPPLPQRSLVSLVIDPKTGQGIATYNDRTTSTITLSNLITIQ